MSLFEGGRVMEKIILIIFFLAGVFFLVRKLWISILADHDRQNQEKAEKIEKQTNEQAGEKLKQVEKSYQERRKTLEKNRLKKLSDLNIDEIGKGGM